MVTQERDWAVCGAEESWTSHTNKCRKKSGRSGGRLHCIYTRVFIPNNWRRFTTDIEDCFLPFISPRCFPQYGVEGKCSVGSPLMTLQLLQGRGYSGTVVAHKKCTIKFCTDDIFSTTDQYNFSHNTPRAMPSIPSDPLKPWRFRACSKIIRR